MVKTSVKGTGQVLHGCASGGTPVSLDTSLPRPASIRLPICRCRAKSVGRRIARVGSPWESASLDDIRCVKVTYQTSWSSEGSTPHRGALS